MVTFRLRDATVFLLQTRPANLKLTQIAEATSIPIGWLKVFARGEIADPSVNRIETLYEYLCGAQIELINIEARKKLLAHV